MTETSFKQAYGVLQRHAETLRNQSEPNIDDLLTIVTESVSAYKTCQSRIEAVEVALEQALGSAGVERPAPAEPSPAAARAAPSAAATDRDDDLPF